MPTSTCKECGGTGVVPDSIDNYVYDPFGMAPCPVCSGARRDEVCDAGAPTGNGQRAESSAPDPVRDDPATQKPPGSRRLPR